MIYNMYYYNDYQYNNQHTDNHCINYFDYKNMKKMYDEFGEIIEHFEKSIDELDKSLNYTKEL